jgi:hypothetical protein
MAEAPPPVIDRRAEARPADWLFLAVLRPAWAYRLELVLVLLLWAVNHWLTARLGRYGAAQVILAAALVVGMLNWTRDPLATALYRSHARRRWALACRHADLASRNDRVPWVMRCALTRAGEQLRVRLPAGAQAPDLESAAERIAAFLGVREVRVTRDPANARYAKVVVIRRDPLADPQPIPWPLAQAERCSLWQPIPVGVDEDGNEVTVTLPERNLLDGGEPGSGKSTIVQLLIAFAALDLSVKLTLFDPKLVELAVWQGCGRLVGPSVEQAIEVLKQLIAELDDRYLTLLANRTRKVTEGDGLPLHLLVVEELAFYTNGPDRKAATAFSVLLRDFVARGRAAGMGDGGDHPEALGRCGADLPARPVRVSLGAAVLDPRRLRHDPRPRVGFPGLLGRDHRPGGAWGGVAAAGGRRPGAAAGVLPGRSDPGRPRPTS